MTPPPPAPAPAAGPAATPHGPGPGGAPGPDLDVPHVSGTFVPTLVEGISKNIDGLCRALRRQGVGAHVDAPALALGDLNRHRVLLTNGHAAGRRAREAARRPGTRLVHFHASLPATAGFARAASRAQGAPVLVHLWNAVRMGAGRSPAGVPAKDRFMHRVANGPLAARAGLAGLPDLVVASRHQERQLRRLGVTARIHRVPNGVDLERNRPATPEERERARHELGVGAGPVLLYYGHTSPWKGLGTLLDALPDVLRHARGAQAVLALTAYGPGTDWVHERIRRAGLQGRVLVRGTSHVPTLHAAADAAALPAAAEVGTACYPNVLLECLAAGLPVAASDVGCIPEVVRHRGNGLLVEPGDASDLAGRLLELASDDALRRRLGAQARASMAPAFGWDVVARRMQAVYAEIAPGAPHPSMPEVTA